MAEDEDGRLKQERIFIGSEKMWCHDIDVTKVDFEFTVSKNAYKKQSIAGVHTE